MFGWRTAGGEKMTIVTLFCSKLEAELQTSISQTFNLFFLSKVADKKVALCADAGLKCAHLARPGFPLAARERLSWRRRRH